MPPSRTTRRLERLLAVVPYVVRHPGTSLTELSALFGVREGDLIEDLNLLMFTGVPPYSPGDLVEMDLEGGKVWIRMADHFSRPVRLTTEEAVAMYLKGTALLAAGVPEAEPLRSALDKLASALGPEAVGALQVEAARPGRTEPLESMRRAASASHRVEIEYFAATRDEVVTRTIDPEHVFSAIGNWYVVAWDRSADGERMFRVDRIKEVRDTGETFAPRGLPGPGRALYSTDPGDIRVRLRLHPGARWVADHYEVERSRKANGDTEVVLPTKDLAWVAKLVLRLGGEAEILDPPELRDQARRLAEETLARYGGGTGRRRKASPRAR